MVRMVALVWLVVLGSGWMSAARAGLDDTEHPVWQTYQPAFVSGVCPFFKDVDYDPDIVTCGHVLVPEDRRDEGSRLIPLAVMRIKSTVDDPPGGTVVRLDGGPGGAGISAQRVRGYLGEVGRPYRDVADLVFFDQRGTGASGADFCRAVPAFYQYGKAMRQGAMDEYVARLERCLQTARSRGIDLGGYSTWANALDVRDLRRALGLDTWTLFGVSYGTELAQAAMLVDPLGVRAAILDSPVPLVPLARGGWNARAYGFRSALDALSDACLADEACAGSVGDVGERVVEIIKAYDAEPLLITGLDPVMFEDSSVVIDGHLVALYLFVMLYSNDLYDEIGLFLDAFEARSTSVISALAEVETDRLFGFSYGEGMSLMVRCQSDRPRVTGAQREAMREALPDLAPWFDRDGDPALCTRLLPEAEPDPTVGQALSTDTPVLVLQGLFDPITPPEFSAAILPGLANATYVEVPYTGHGVINSHVSGCGRTLFQSFVRNPGGQVSVSCAAAVSPPAFVTAYRSTGKTYALYRETSSGRPPVAGPLALFALVFAVIAYPLGFLSRRIEGKPGGSSTAIMARLTSWSAAAVAVAAAAWVLWLLRGWVADHAAALPVGLPAGIQWPGLMFLLAVILGVIALIESVRAPGLPVGTRLGGLIIAVCCVLTLVFATSAGFGPLP